MATALPEAGLYFVEFNAAVAYRSLIGAYLWDRIASARPEPSWLSAEQKSPGVAAGACCHRALGGP